MVVQEKQGRGSVVVGSGSWGLGCLWQRLGLGLSLAVARAWVSIGGGSVLGFFTLSPSLSRMGL